MASLAPLPFSRAHVQRCREAWNSPQQLAELFSSFCQSCDFSDVPSRMRLEEIEGVQLALDVIRDEKEPALMSRAWLVLQNFVLLHSVDDPNEMKPIDIFVQRGGIELAAIELNRPEPRWGHTILTTLAWVSTNERAVPRVIGSGVHKIGISYIREPHPMFLDISMSFIRSASAARACRATLRADGALDAFIPFVSCNKSAEPFQARRGFRAASVVGRLAGNDESGIGPSILRNNHDLILTTLNIFDQVLEAGPAGTVINMLVNPHFITMDLLIISTSDVNKPLLVPAIPICVNALDRRGEQNGPMVADIVKMFLQLSFEPACRAELTKHAPRLFELLGKLVPSPQHLRMSKAASSFLGGGPTTFYEHDSETVMSAQMLRNALMNYNTASKPAPVSPGASFVQGIVRRMVQQPASRSNSSSTFDQEEYASASSKGGVAIDSRQMPWVMISYSWHSAELAKKLDEFLQTQGLRVWVDYRCMDRDVGDSLDQAVREAGAMIVLATSRYKESAVCRKEVEAAEERRVPLIIVQAEDNYKPDGWLALSATGAAILAGSATASSMMMPGWTVPVLKSSIPAMMKRLGMVSPGCVPVKSPPPMGMYSPTKSMVGDHQPLAQASNGPDPKLLEAIAALTMAVNDMRQELNDLRLEVRGMKSN